MGFAEGGVGRGFGPTRNAKDDFENHISMISYNLLCAGGERGGSGPFGQES